RREQERMRRRVEANRLEGRKPIKAQSGNVAVLDEEPKTIHLNDESDIFVGQGPNEGADDEEDDIPEKGSGQQAPILFLNQDKPEKTKKTADPKIAKSSANYKLPPVNLLREGERSQKLDEDELKDRARAIEEKCLEFDVQGRVTQINPGPVVTTFEFKPEA